jgi:hypothetical protein
MRRATLVLCALSLGALVVHADEPVVPQRPVRLVEKDGHVLASVTFPELFDGDLLEQLSSGFAQTVIVRVLVYPEDQDGAVWFTSATARAVYAQWDEVYLVRIRDPSGERNLTERTREAARIDVTTLRDLAVCPTSALDEGRGYFLGIVVEVNPVTQELAAEVRKWLTRPRGGQVGTDSLFGSFVSIFANPKVPEADKTLRFRSQTFTLQRRP